MVTQARQDYYSPQEYLELEREAAYRSEYLDGEIFAMAGASTSHNRINVNLTVQIGSRLKGGACEAFSHDMKIVADQAAMFAYPDVAVVCGEPQFHDEVQDVCTNPIVIFEILSPSTEAFDRGKKWARYQQTESLKQYVLVSQDQPRVEMFTRQPDGQWMLSTVKGLDAVLSIDSIGCVLKLSELYDRVEFPPEEPWINPQERDI